MGEVPGGSQEAPASLDTPLDKILDSVIDWSKRLESGELSAAAQNTVLSLDWRPSWGSGHQASGTPPLFLPEAQEDLNKADVLKKTHSINKVPPMFPWEIPFSLHPHLWLGAQGVGGQQLLLGDKCSDFS